MTYSRPSTSAVSVRIPGDRGNRTKIVGQPGGGGVAPSAQRLDRSNPQIAGKNAARGYEEIGQFLEDFAPVVKTVGTALIEEQANNQLGKLMVQDPTLGSRYRNADADAQAKIDTLHPYTKELFLRSQVTTSQRAYQELLPSLALADSRLTAANARDNPEQFAAALSEVQSKAQDQSGVANLPPELRGAMAQDLATVNGAVRGKLFAAQEQQRQSDNSVMTGDGLVSVIETLTDNISVERNYGGDTTDFVREGQRIFAQDVRTRTSSGQPTPVRHLSSLLGRMGVKLDGYRESNQFERAEELLDTLEALAASDLKLDNGLNYWTQSIKVGDQGKTVNVASFISNQRRVTESAGKKESVREAEANALPLAVRAAQGDMNAVLDLQASLPSIESADALKAVLSVFGPAQNFGEQLTARDSDLIDLVYDPNRNRDEVRATILDRMNQGRISLQSTVSLLEKNLRGEQDPLDPNVAAAGAGRTAINSGMLQSQAALLTERQQEVARNEGYGDLDFDNQAKQNALFLQAEAFKRTTEQIQTAQEAGTPLTKEEVNQAYLDNVQAIVDERTKELSAGGVPRGVPIGQIVADDLNAMRANILEGKRGLEIFPPRVMDLAQKKGINLQAPDAMSRVSKLLYGQMGLVTDKAGNKEYPNPGEQIKTMIRDAEGERKREGPKPRGFYNGASDKESGDSYGGPTRPSDLQKENGDQSSLNEQLLEGLQRLAGVVTPGGGSSAKAGELPEMTVNGDQLELLAKLWSGRERPSLTTPGAPQVEASAPTTPVPLSIRNDRHEFFVAIGINEGTRTANGGYTKAYYGHRDQGDGNYNRGTVSGGRGNNLSPQQVDRRWMGVLTDASIRYSSVLKQLGLQSGTQGYNRAMFNILDLTVQAPAAVRTFLVKLNTVKAQNWTVEAFAKARADSFYRYDGTLDTTFPNYQTLFRDQRGRAGTFDYKKRF